MESGDGDPPPSPVVGNGECTGSPPVGAPRTGRRPPRGRVRRRCSASRRAGPGPRCRRRSTGCTSTTRSSAVPLAARSGLVDQRAVAAVDAVGDHAARDRDDQAGVVAPTGRMPWNVDIQTPSVTCSRRKSQQVPHRWSASPTSRLSSTLPLVHTGIHRMWTTTGIPPMAGRRHLAAVGSSTGTAARDGPYHRRLRTRARAASQPGQRDEVTERCREGVARAARPGRAMLPRFPGAIYRGHRLVDPRGPRA